MLITTKQQTFIKQSTRQEGELSKENKHLLPSFFSLELTDIELIGKHFKIKLLHPIQNKYTWYAFIDHFLLSKDIELDEEEDAILETIDSYAFSTVPKDKISYSPNWNDFSSRISEYFTVGELLQYDRNRIPKEQYIKDNIIALCKELDKLRRDWGEPIGVTSGYRPPAVNRAVGGVSNSQHLTGKAIDIYPLTSSYQVFYNFVNAGWNGALGYAPRKGFIHLDMRGNKGWKTGGTREVRWNY